MNFSSRSSKLFESMLKIPFVSGLSHGDQYGEGEGGSGGGGGGGRDGYQE